MRDDTSGNVPVAVVIIPTYNEIETIGKLVRYLFEYTFPLVAFWDLNILIVDGNSPDGTADAIRELQPSYKKLHLIVEKEKEGIGAAYFKGFRYAEETLDAEVLIEFDGDFQHPPESIPMLLDKIDEGADLVLGSREVKGGSYPSHWGFRRLFLSKVGGFVARFILFFPTKKFFSVTDPTTGLKATRVNEFYYSLDFNTFINRSFGYKLEMLFKLVRNGAGISEIPLSFKLREQGESKIENSTAKDILKTIFRLRINDPATRRFFKFGLVGFIGYLVNAFGVEVFNSSGFIDRIATAFMNHSDRFLWGILAQKSSWAAAFATELAIINNFTWNNLWTFRHNKINGVRVIKKFLHFNLTSLGAILLQFFAVGGATLVLGDTVIVRQIALVLAIGFLVVPYNWLMYNHFIWKKK